MGYMLRGSKNGLVDVRGPPSHFNWKSLEYMLRGLNGSAGEGEGTLNGLGSWRFLVRCPSRGLRKTGGHVENGSSHFHAPPPPLSMGDRKP